MYAARFHSLVFRVLLPCCVLLALTGCARQKRLIREQESSIDSLYTVTQNLHAEIASLRTDLRRTRDTLRTFDGIVPEQYRRDQQALRDLGAEVRRLNRELEETREELEGYEYFDAGPYEREMQSLKNQIARLEFELAAAREENPGAPPPAPADEPEADEEAEEVAEDEEAEEERPAAQSREGFSMKSRDRISLARGGYSWVVALVQTRAAADRVAARYQRQGYRVGVLRQRYRGEEAWRVLLGQFPDEASALAARRELPSGAPDDAWLLKLD